VPDQEPTPLRGLRIRRAPLPPEALLVVRGDHLDPRVSRLQAERFLRRYQEWGRYGLSAYYAGRDSDVDDLAADQLRRFPELALFRVADLLAKDFEVVPTFRTPHVTIAFRGYLDARLAALESLRIEVRANPYTERWP
jgi:hypothetical protein